MSYTVTDDGIWSTLEPSLGIVNACLPLLKPLGQKLCGRVAYLQKHRRTKSSIYDNRLAASRRLPAKIEAYQRGACTNDAKRQHTVLSLHEDDWLINDVQSSRRFKYVSARRGQNSDLYHDARNKLTERQNLPVTEAWDAACRMALPVYIPLPATKRPTNREDIVIRDRLMMDTGRFPVPFEAKAPDYFQSQGAGVNWV